MTLATPIIPSKVPSLPQPPPPRLKRWTKREYNDLVDRGAFRGQHIYLFRGELLEMSPQYHPHAFAVTRLTRALSKAFVEPDFELRMQLPFETPGESTPEPDALVCTAAQFLRRPHPDAAVLAIEVADSSLDVDREKALEYSAAGVPEYWILDVNQRRIEVYRNPIADPTTLLGFRYPPPRFVGANESIEPLARPSSPITVASLFSTP